MKRVALVTGGVRGIGKAISLALLNEGYAVAANYVGSDASAAELSEATGIPCYKFDVSDFEEVKHNIRMITEDLGPIDVLINNAGITRDTTMHKMTLDQWQAVINTDLGACFNTCRCVIESMRERRYGRIVNIGSLNGQAGEYGQVNYCAAKAGIHGFNKALALESAKYGITVNAVAPGYVKTDMALAVPQHIQEKLLAKIPVGRWAEPEEIARGVSFLVSEEAGFITGSTLTINGGQNMY